MSRVTAATRLGNTPAVYIDPWKEGYRVLILVVDESTSSHAEAHVMCERGSAKARW